MKQRFGSVWCPGWLTLAIMVTACGAAGGGEEEEEEEGEESGIVELSDDGLEAARLTTATVRSGELAHELELTCEIVADPDRLAMVGPRTAGRIGRVHVRVTIPIERGMSGLPRVENIRSVSKFGLSQVTLVFEDGADIYWARQLVSERLQEVRSDIAEGYGRPELAPLSTGLGEVYQFELRGTDHEPMELRSILAGYVIPQLTSVPGVVEVNSFGGELRTYELELDPDRLVAYQLSLQDVIEALESANGAAGGAYIDRGRELLIVRGDGLVESLEDLADTVIVTSDDGIPILARDLGRPRRQARRGHPRRRG